jgi:hypothetical protein
VGGSISLRDSVPAGVGGLIHVAGIGGSHLSCPPDVALWRDTKIHYKVVECSSKWTFDDVWRLLVLSCYRRIVCKALTDVIVLILKHDWSV